MKSRRKIDFSEEKSSQKTPKAIADKQISTTFTKPSEQKTGNTVHSEMFRLQESVRMIVTPLMDTETSESVVINPAIDVHQAVTVRQKPHDQISSSMSTSRAFANIATNHLMAMDALHSPTKTLEKRLNTLGDQAMNDTINDAPDDSERHKTVSNMFKQLQMQQTIEMSRPRAKKTICHHKTIVECSASSSSPSTDDSRLNINNMTHGRLSCGNLEKRSIKTYSSPDSPLSKMCIMPNPKNDAEYFNLSVQNKSLIALEIPTPERLLPIGPQEGVTTIIERMRQCLKIPDISHLKQESSIDISDSTKDELTPNSRANSPRRLIKQVALEDPLQVPTNTITSTNAEPTHDSCKSILKTVSASAKMSNGVLNGTAKAPQVINQIKHAEGRRATKKPRQKMVPFNIDFNNTMDLRSRYAGAWPPPQFQELQEEHLEDFNNEVDNEISQSHTGHQHTILNRVVNPIIYSII